MQISALNLIVAAQQAQRASREQPRSVQEGARIAKPPADHANAADSASTEFKPLAFAPAAPQTAPAKPTPPPAGPPGSRLDIRV